MLTELSVLYAMIQLHGQSGLSRTSLPSESCLDQLRDWTRNAKSKAIFGDFMVAEVERWVMRESTLVSPGTSQLLPQHCQPETGTGWSGKVLTQPFHHLFCSTEDASFSSGLSDLRPCSPSSRSAEGSDGKITPDYRKLSITLSILQNQAHDKSKGTLKISSPFILLHLNFLVCQLWVIMLLHPKRLH